MEQQRAADTPKQLYNPQTQLGKQVMELISDKLTKKFDKLRSGLKSGDTSGRQRTRQWYERTAKKVREFDSST
jgi:broad specificity phosphatase PhoE